MLARGKPKQRVLVAGQFGFYFLQGGHGPMLA
jgi:hypothetical protein